MKSLTHTWSHAAVHPAAKSAFTRIWTGYQGRCPSGHQVIEELASLGHIKEFIHHDHFAYRTFGVPGLGISSLASALAEHGYKQQEYFTFPTKKLLATWFAPPQHLYAYLPRVFVSELQVELLSSTSQDIIHEYTSKLSRDSREVWDWVMSAALPWTQPSQQQYQMLLEESEYGAWVLAHGYQLNHTALSVHRMHGLEGGTQQLVELLQQQGVELNKDGGIVKTSPDGALLQCSTIADIVCYTFSDGSVRSIAGPYIEFAERKAKPEYAVTMFGDELQEWQLRDGFEVGSADKIFQSTNIAS